MNSISSFYKMIVSTKSTNQEIVEKSGWMNMHNDLLYRKAHQKSDADPRSSVYWNWQI
jgi:hypothetical protein